MNRKEFLDILRDYLKQDFSEDEINDIIRDYEEYFVDGEIEGKTDLDTISALGSPKSIAMDLINQIKHKEDNDVKSKIKDMNFKIKRKIKKIFFNCKNLIDEKLTPRLDGKDSISSKGVKIILFLLSLVLIIPTFFVVCFMAFMAGFLALSLIAFLITIPLMVSFSWNQMQIACFFIFISVAFIGFQILSWQIFIFVIRYMKKIYKRYINWIKTRKIYINASEIKEDMNLYKNKGGRDNE